MAINTFKKDCKHTSSRIRGMALRHLCSFKSSDYVDNILPVLREALLDPEPYVKKAAILGCLKLFYFHPKSVTGIMDLQYR
jgi:AP-4 complex subunit beta-1